MGSTFLPASFHFHLAPSPERPDPLGSFSVDVKGRDGTRSLPSTAPLSITHTRTDGPTGAVAQEGPAGVSQVRPGLSLMDHCGLRNGRHTRVWGISSLHFSPLQISHTTTCHLWNGLYTSAKGLLRVVFPERGKEEDCVVSHPQSDSQRHWSRLLPEMRGRLSTLASPYAITH